MEGPGQREESEWRYQSDGARIKQGTERADWLRQRQRQGERQGDFLRGENWALASLLSALVSHGQYLRNKVSGGAIT